MYKINPAGRYRLILYGTLGTIKARTFYEAIAIHF